MILAWLLALQAAGSPAGAAPTPSDFDLAKYRPAEPEPGSCVAARPGEIVVCGRRQGGGAYPLAEMEAKFREKPLRAETSIAPGTSLRAYGEQVDFGNGQVSKRAMIGVKLKF